MSESGRAIHYTMIIEWDPRDDIFVVTVPELPGCRTHGSTYEEAVRQGQDAIESWLDGADEDGDTPPAPRFYDDERWTWPELRLSIDRNAALARS
jgi:predicted RNase H-like HicB family nuclease